MKDDELQAEALQRLNARPPLRGWRGNAPIQGDERLILRAQYRMRTGRAAEQGLSAAQLKALIAEAGGGE